MPLLTTQPLSLPVPSALTHSWSLGATLGIIVSGQILSGVLLSMLYLSDTNLAFATVLATSVDASYGAWCRMSHANGASVLFAGLYLHMARGLYYRSYRMSLTWLSGWILLVLFMASAFLGYVLPWGQMSFWGATVITSLLSVIPYVGPSSVEWLWGSFSVSGPTLSRFSVLHYLAPILAPAVIILHLSALHSSGSTSPLGLKALPDLIPFGPYFSMKDLTPASILILVWCMTLCLAPYKCLDVDNWSLADPLNTPAHIMPEWYFLFAYTILRSVPNKLGGVLALLASLSVLLIGPISPSLLTAISPSRAYLSWWLFSTVSALTWLGSLSPETPYSDLAVIASASYFTSSIMLLTT